MSFSLSIDDMSHILMCQFYFQAWFAGEKKVGKKFIGFKVGIDDLISFYFKKQTRLKIKQYWRHTHYYSYSAITGPIGKECADLWPRIASAANAIV
ncbi:unnamed protein product [Trifolium pratense]|uniref:Uncharacterized protein n=1 Tax=Trifolium pratense TaxID=57577 RepID=A0ACB0JCR8_TRIPR|nr:unnamed protein product [Trifolium pratense]